MTTVLADAEIEFRSVVRERKLSLGAGAKSTARYDHVFDFARRYVAGIGLEHVGCAYSARHTLTTAVPYIDIDLGTGLVSVLDGTAVTLPIIMGCFIANITETPGRHLLLGQGVDPYAVWVLTAEDALRVGPDGLHVDWNPIDGLPTNGDTSDILRIAAGAVLETTFDILIVGRIL